MSHLALTQAALNKFAKMPGGAADLRQQRRNAEAAKALILREAEPRIAALDALIHRIGVALGEASV